MFSRILSFAAALGVTLFMGISSSEGRIPTLSFFKDVTASLRPEYSFYSPTLGMAAIESGLIENLRFYGNFDAAYKKDAPEKREYSGDSSDDPMWNVLKILFPSSGGTLTTSTQSPGNFGRHVDKTRTVALLLNYVHQLRTTKGDYTPPFPIKALEGEKTPSSQKKEKEHKYPQKRDVTFASFQKYKEKGIVTATEAQEEILKEKKGKISLTWDQIRAVINAEASSKKEMKKAPLVDSRQDLKEEIYRTLAVTESTKKENLKQEITHLLSYLKEALSWEMGGATPAQSSPSLGSMEESLEEKVLRQEKELKRQEKGKKKEGEPQKTQDPFYPKYMVEQILLAFLCEHFHTQEDLYTFLKELKSLDTTQALPLVGEILISPSKITKEEVLKLLKKKPKDLDGVYRLVNGDLFTRVIPYKSGASPISNDSTWPYDRQQDKQLNTITFPDCAEVVIRHLLNMLTYDKDTESFNLSSLARGEEENLLKEEDFPPFPEEGSSSMDIPSSGKAQGGQKGVLSFLKAFYTQQTPPLANSGTVEMRSLWNEVVGDLNHLKGGPGPIIHYYQGNDADHLAPFYDLDPGFINMVRVLQKVCGLSDNTLDITDAPFEDMKKWVEESLLRIFEKVNPNYTYELETKELTAGQGRSGMKEVMGELNVKVKAKEEEEDGDDKEPLFSLAIIMSPIHAKIINLKRAQDELFKSQNFQSFLQSGTSEASLKLLFPKKPVFLAKEEPLYHFYPQLLQDNDSKIQVIKKISDLPLENINHFHRRMLAHLLKTLSWDDDDTVQQVSPLILNLLTYFPEVLREKVKAFFLSYVPYTQKLESLDLTGFTKLKTLRIEDSAIQKIIGLESCVNLEELHDFDTQKLESLDLTGLTKLKTLRIEGSAIQKIIGLESCVNLEELHAFRAQKLESLDLTGLTKLKTLMIEDSAIQKIIGLESCVNLEGLYAFRAQKLESLDLTGLTKLKTLDMRNSAIKNLIGLENFPQRQLKVIQ